MIIGLSGKALSGKDTTADYLVKNCGFYEKVGFANNLKNAVMGIFNLSFDDVNVQDFKSRLFEKPIITTTAHIQNIVFWMRKTHDIQIDFTDLEMFTAKSLASPRDVLQFVGTDVMRTLCSSYHSDVVSSKFLNHTNIVVSDVRFLNEVSVIKNNNGFVVRLERDIKMFGGKTNHQSEVALDGFKDWDFILKNNSSLDDLYKSVDYMLLKLREV